MSKATFLALGALASGALLALAQTAGDLPLAPYPEDYQTWRHLGSVFSVPKDQNRATAPHGMIHHIYANEQALVGLRTGAYPEGAVFVADWFALKQKYPGGFDEGERNRVDVMVRDARFTATGGWEFDQFAGDSRTVRNVTAEKVLNQCFNCHAKREASGYVFSRLRP